MSKHRKRYSQVLSIDKILGDVVNNILDKKKSTLFKIELAWNNVLESSITKNCQPQKFRRGLLTVQCSNPLWKSELFFLKDAIKSKINKELGEELIKDIFFV